MCLQENKLQKNNFKLNNDPVKSGSYERVK